MSRAHTSPENLKTFIYLSASFTPTSHLLPNVALYNPIGTPSTVKEADIFFLKYFGIVIEFNFLFVQFKTQIVSLAVHNFRRMKGEDTGTDSWAPKVLS